MCARPKRPKKVWARLCLWLLKAASVTGLFVVGLGLLAVSGFLLVTKTAGGPCINLGDVNQCSAGGAFDLSALAGLAFGASLISVFARLGGGIFTKGADVGTDMVGKVEAGIPEDDPRNPGVIADNVGDNVGDCAGMAADLFETYVVSAVAVILLGSALFPGLHQRYYLSADYWRGFHYHHNYRHVVCQTRQNSKNIMGAMYKGFAVTGVLSAIAFWPITQKIMGDNGTYSVKQSFLLRVDWFGCYRTDYCNYRILHFQIFFSG